MWVSRQEFRPFSDPCLLASTADGSETQAQALVSILGNHWPPLEQASLKECTSRHLSKDRAGHVREAHRAVSSGLEGDGRFSINASTVGSHGSFHSRSRKIQRAGR